MFQEFGLESVTLKTRGYNPNMCLRCNAKSQGVAMIMVIRWLLGSKESHFIRLNLYKRAGVGCSVVPKRVKLSVMFEMVLRLTCVFVEAYKEKRQLKWLRYFLFLYQDIHHSERYVQCFYSINQIKGGFILRHKLCIKAELPLESRSRHN